MPSTHILEYSINDIRKTHRNVLDVSGAVPFGIPRECGAAQPRLLVPWQTKSMLPCSTGKDSLNVRGDRRGFSHFTARSQRLYVDSSWVLAS